MRVSEMGKNGVLQLGGRGMETLFLSALDSLPWPPLFVDLLDDLGQFAVGVLKLLDQNSLYYVKPIENVNIFHIYAGVTARVAEVLDCQQLVTHFLHFGPFRPQPADPVVKRPAVEPFGSGPPHNRPGTRHLHAGQQQFDCMADVV